MNMLQELIRECNKNDLRDVWRWAKERNDQLSRSEAAKWYLGARVTFYASGRHWTGVITKMNSKTASIDCSSEKWNVHYGQFKAAPDNANPVLCAI